MEFEKHNVCKWSTRATFVIVLSTQVIILNQYLALYEGKSSFQAFLLVYVPTLVLWAKGQWSNRSHIVAAGVWFLYVVPLGIETGWILGRLMDKIDNNSFLDHGFLKYVLSLASLVFLFLHVCEFDSQMNTSQSWLRSADVLDSVDLLGVLLETEKTVSLPASVQNAIISFTLINTLALTFALTESLKSSMSHQEDNIELPKVLLVYLLVQAFLINLPFLVIRLMLHYSFKHSSSVFAFKNFLVILVNLSNVVSSCCFNTCLVSNTNSSSRGRSTQPSVGDTDESLSTVSSGRRPPGMPGRVDRSGQLIRAIEHDFS